MIATKVFQSGNSQAIRIPNELRTDKKEFYIRKFGEGYYMIPVSDPWSLVRSSLGKAKDAPGLELDQPSLQDLPEKATF